MSNRGSPAPRRPVETLVSSNSVSSDLSDTRKRQSKRDEAIRKKIENELNRKRPGSAARRGPQQQSSKRGGGGGKSDKRAAGTVSALRPLPALTVPSSITVADASQLCAAKRTDCVLVVDEDEHLCGIFTAKDLAFRVIGEGLDPRTTLVSSIMTPNPMVTRDTTSATDALQTMVSRGFRHLPVCNEEGDVVGLLDITKVFHSSLEKLERAYGSSQQLYSALEGVQSEWSGANAALVAYVQQIRESMAAPDLNTLIDARTSAVTVGIKTSVRDAAKLMREHHTTAVIVMETPSSGEAAKIAGIFTSKDVVLRVIAAGLDSKSCSVVRVMTPHPDTAFPSTTIQEALRKMHDGHYLNLPVVDHDGSLVACVDVLKLTYATLEQISSISAGTEAGGAADANGGPMWTKFFNSFAGAGPEPLNDGGDGDTESIVSASDLPSTPLRERPAHHRLDSETPGSELAPGDSASVGHEESIAPSAMPSAIVDDGTYLFKFSAPGGTTHRFQARYSGQEVYELIKEVVTGKLSSDAFFAPAKAPVPGAAIPEAKRDPTDFTLSYMDDDGDLVRISHDTDVQDAVKTARKAGKDRVVLILKGGRGWEEEMNQKAAVEAKASALASIVEDDLEEVTEKAKAGAKKAAKKVSTDDGLAFGFLPQEYLIPAAVGLGVAIVGIFAVSRMGGSKA